MMTTPPESHFPQDYRGARKAFIAACEARGIDVISRVHPSAKGPDGKPLFLDVCALGPRTAQKALLLICGTHGVEGYFGSGVMTGLLRNGVAPPPDDAAGDDPCAEPVRLCLGPAGQRGQCRSEPRFRRSYAQPPSNPGYDALAEAIALRDVRDAGFARADAALHAYAQAHGRAAWQQAISAGQYNHPDGLFYGGDREPWSLQMLRAVLREDLSRAKTVIAIDFHTGLGESGAGEMIVEAAPGTPAYARARAIWGDMIASTSAGGSVSAPLNGTMDEGLAGFLPGVDVTFAALEVGTIALEPMLRALRLANWQDRFAPDDTRAAEISAAMREAFYTDTPAWKQAVWALGERTVGQALAAL
jgi:hypothetical protein